ncbi:hypothetical protein C4571_02580 [Candidatus Parcubacteria bacterium]|nr:MAG: hypothetical protein C4571_02580 [Candidatus Parcubacteria bacterium]
MDKFLSIIQKLKYIEAEADYTARSRRFILSISADREPKNFWELFLHTAQVGAAVALTGLLIFLILGGFSGWKSLSPLRLSSLDPASLKAEAQAIDIQIRLTNLQYQEPLSASESTIKEAAIYQRNEAAEPLEQGNTDNEGDQEESLGIDEVLLRLAE